MRKPNYRFEVIVDHAETANKCTVMPLFYREDFRIRRVPSALMIPKLDADILLHPEGIHSLADFPQIASVTRVSAIDCIWRRLQPLTRRLENPIPTFIRIPEGFVTAYPRHSKLTQDPSGGLATIEALFIAAAFSGHWDETLLREYFFGKRFLEMNAGTFRHYDVAMQSTEAVSFDPRSARDARHRRASRGRGPKSPSPLSVF